MEMFVVLAMIFCHILDDFCLQSFWLANGKQKSWWEKNAPDPLYKHDYVVALIMHSVSWAFMIMLPIFWYYNFEVTFPLVLAFGINAAIHAIVDNAKANRHAINLIADQSIHMMQLMVTSLIFVR